MKKIILSFILLIALVLSGCGDINVQQTFERNGDFSTILEVKSEQSALTGFIKESLETQEDYNESLMKITDEGIVYDFGTDNLNELKGSSKELLKTIYFEKEFKFPFNYYKLVLDNEMPEDYGDDYDPNELGIEMTYTIELFGKVSDTNGELVEDEPNKVVFNMYDNKVYYATVKESFIKTMFKGEPELNFIDNEE